MKYTIISPRKHLTFESALVDAIEIISRNNNGVTAIVKVEDIFLYIEPNMSIKEILKSYQQRTFLRFEVAIRNGRKFDR